MIQTIHAKDHDEWLTLRKRGIGSSEVGTILGVNPYDTPYKLWLRKTGKAPAIEENTAMRMGHILEPVVALLYEETTGNKVLAETADDFVVINDRLPFMVASPDRYCETSDGQRLLLECKTTAMRVDEDNLPKSWFCQVQYLLATTEMEDAAIAWLVNGRDFGTMKIKRVDTFVDYLLDKVNSFWQHVQSDTPPALQEGNAVDVETRWRSACSNKSVAATDEIWKICTEVQSVRSQMKELEDKDAALTTKIKEFMTDAEMLQYGDTLLATWKNVAGRTTFDSKTFKQDHPDLFKQYSKVGEASRRFQLKM